MNTLTDRQQDVYDYIKQYILDNHRPPTRLEICEDFGWSSPKAAHDHVLALQRKGYIGSQLGKYRAIKVLKSKLVWVDCD